MKKKQNIVVQVIENGNVTTHNFEKFYSNKYGVIYLAKGSLFIFRGNKEKFLLQIKEETVNGGIEALALSSFIVCVLQKTDQILL